MKTFFKRVIGFTAILLVLAGILFFALPPKGYIPVLMYHFIGTEEEAKASKNFVTQEGFRRQMDFLKRFGYRVISIGEYEEILTGKKKPQGREVLITFDDGESSFESKAFPVLSESRFPALIFLVNYNMRFKMRGAMPEDTVRRLLGTGLVTIGAHTMTHRPLTRIRPERLEDEILGSRLDLEKRFGVPVPYLSYPYGETTADAVGVVKKAGYRLAFGTSAKKLRGLERGPYTLTRLKTSRSSDNPLVFWFKLSGIYERAKDRRPPV